MSKSVRLHLEDESATLHLGGAIGRHARAGDVVLLFGDLGCGKTTLVRGAARSLGVDEPVTSPSFALLHVYQGSLPVYHCDAYRLSGLQELEDLGFYEWCESGGVVFVEWAERVEGRLPGSVLEVHLEHSADGGRDATVGRILGRPDLAKELAP